MNIARKSFTINFNLEISLKEVRLINTYNNLSYIPNDSISESILLKLAERKDFSIEDLYEVDQPILIFEGEKFMFKRDLSRIDLEKNLMEHGQKKLNIGFLSKKIDDIGKSLQLAQTKNNKLLSETSQNIQSFITNTSDKIEVLNKDLEYIESGEYLKSLEKPKKTKEENPASQKNKIISLLDETYGHLKGTLYYCRGAGCSNQTGTIWGSNPYTCDDGGKYCLAAKHCGIIDESGGFFEVRQIGSYPNYTPSFQNGIQSASYSQYNGYTIHSFFGDEPEIPNACRNY